MNAIWGVRRLAARSLWRLSSGSDCCGSNAWIEPEYLRLRGVQPVCQRSRGAVFLGEQRIERRPFDADCRIIPADGSFARGMVDRRAFVLKFGELRQHIEAPGKSRRRPELLLVLGRHFRAEPLAQRGGSFPDID